METSALLWRDATRATDEGASANPLFTARLEILAEVIERTPRPSGPAGPLRPGNLRRPPTPGRSHPRPAPANPRDLGRPPVMTSEACRTTGARGSEQLRDPECCTARELAAGPRSLDTEPGHYRRTGESAGVRPEGVHRPRTRKGECRP